MADVWDDVRVQRWLAQAEGLDRQLAPVTAALFEAARLRPGDRVLDVGCGHGPTTRHAATRVGAGGAVTAVDVAEAMLRAGAAAGTPPGAAAIEWVQADVVAWEPAATGLGEHHAVISRFGVMFFTDPVRAFANLRSATASDGRLAVATWAHRHRSQLFELPLAAALPVLRARGVDVEVPPADAAAFSLGTAERLTEVLGAAGWHDVAVVEHEVQMAVHGGLDPAGAAQAGLDLGPTRVLMADQPDDLRADVAAAIAEVYGDHTDEHGHVTVTATFLVTTATT
jgi:SAM-dependent methyltransferase